MPKVGIAYFHIDGDVKVLDYIYKNSDGCVVATAGNGGTSFGWGTKIKNKKDGKPVVSSSRIGNGYTATRSTSPKHLIGAGTLNPQKARILLQLALTKTKDIEEIREMFEIY